MRSDIEWSGARLRSITDIAAGIRLFEIEPSARFVAPAPGSHLKVTVYVDGRPDVRSYSIVGPCADGLYRIAVKRLPDSRGGSLYMWSLEPGANLTISQPANHFELTYGRPDYLLIAGGIGITPIYGMALALSQAKARVRLLYAARTEAELAFAEELRERLGDRLELFLDAEGRRVDLPAEFARLAPGGEVYLCGPIGMLEAAKTAWADSGRPVGGLRFETFGNSGRYATEAFRVRVPRLGLDLLVPENKSMLDALEDAGVAMIHDCRRGECGLCAVDILETEGVVDHRDVFFSDAQKQANAKMCTCVSRVARGGVTIDTADRTAAMPARQAASITAAP
ncbi:PDR/VanB family oxidoreductase [Azospirillum sp. SYSU D00513]|uniref:PDR/VanB family oxidoreductase n=1 Tax=Azospirillum sp. SYSU D00513 TaxID=2812561 RepID=UPI001A9784CF|nr:PDR/VanB family oxidoreductase [Azospirillum sp. SYSU D00513]